MSHLKMLLLFGLLALSASAFGQNITLEDIYFDKEQYALKATSYKQLDQLVGILLEHESLQVKISGHTDNKGDEEVNMELSINRADAVSDYLIQKGVAYHRIKAVGYGEYNPIASNESEEGKQKNRRVTFRLIEK